MSVARPYGQRDTVAGFHLDTKGPISAMFQNAKKNGLMTQPEPLTKTVWLVTQPHYPKARDSKPDRVTILGTVEATSLRRAQIVARKKWGSFPQIGQISVTPLDDLSDGPLAHISAFGSFLSPADGLPPAER